MKTYSYRSRNSLVLIATCLFLSAYTANQAMSSDAPSGRAMAGPASVRPVNGAARLIIHRIADLGNDLIVRLWIDDVAVASIAYGHTYEALLPPGRHVISVLPTPNPRWKIPWQMTLNVQNGQTYSFTAMGDGSGFLILTGGLRPPHARWR
jgi:hypothetical protein